MIIKAIPILTLLFSPAKAKEIIAQEKNEQNKPNILFILLDDLGKEWINEYGGVGVEAPNIQRLAQNGITFNNTYSMPQSTPTRVCLLTGQYPFRNGWVNHYDVPRWGHGARFDPEKNPSYAKVLQESGYKTCIAGKWQLNDFRLEPNILNEVGFDDYCMWTGGEGGNEKLSLERYWDPYIHTKEGSRTYKGKFGEDVFADHIIDFMRENKDGPMMIYYPMCLPHGPLTTTPLEPNAPQEEQHRAMVRYADFILGKLMNALSELEIAENTIIVWTTDNGTAGNISNAINGNLISGGKTYLSENGINAPMIVSCPGIVPEGAISDALVDFSDFAPTFIELSGGKPDPKYIYDGYSFANVLLGKKDKSEREWILAMGSLVGRLENGRLANSHKYRDRAIRDERYKAYVNPKGEIYEIIDLKKDFYEENNLIESTDEEVKKAITKFKIAVKSFPKEDGIPIYTKLEKSFYDIDENELLENCEKGVGRNNKRIHPKIKKQQK